MKKENTVVVKQGMGFFGFLALVFIILKLVGTINWSWFFVLLPITFVPLLIAAVFIVFLLYLLVKTGIRKVCHKTNTRN